MTERKISWIFKRLVFPVLLSLALIVIGIVYTWIADSYLEENYGKGGEK